MNRLSLFCERVIEACWLAALVIAPLFINFHSSVSFEPNKSTVIRSIALVMLAAFIIRRPSLENIKPFIRQPLFIITILLGMSYLVSTFLSVLPTGSWWGSSARGQGTYSLMGYFIIFAITTLTLRNRAQLERIFATIILTSIPIMLYGFIQKMELDVLPWGADFSTRIASTMGNPIFLGSYLIMVIPLTTYLLIRSVSNARLINSRSLFYAIILLAQLACLLLTESRGPLLGLIAGLFFFVVLYGLVFGKRWLALSSYIAAALIIGFFMVLAMPNTPLAGLKSRMGRLSQMFEAREGAATVRLLIWQGVINMVRSDYYRAAIGYGPETMFVPYHKYCPAELITSENKITFPDRSHNEFFDTVITNGLIGALLYLLLFGAIIFYAFKTLGLAARRRILPALLLFFGLAGLLIPILLDKTIFIALGVPLGLVIGAEIYLFIYVIPFGFTLGRNPHEYPGSIGQDKHLAPEGKPSAFCLLSSDCLLLITLFSALISHFVETQFGIDLTASRVYFYSYLAILIVIMFKGLAGDQTTTHPESSNQSPESPDSAQPLSTICWALFVTLILTTMAFNFIPAQITEESAGRTTRVLAMMGTTWLAAGMLFYLIYRSAIPIALLSAGLASVFFIILISILPPLYSPTAAVTVFYGWLLGIILTLAWTLPNKQTPDAIPAQTENRKSGHPPPEPFDAVSPFRVLSSVMIAIAVLFIIIMTCLNPVKGDIIYKIGSGQERAGNWEIALNYYEQALVLSPDKGNYYGASARMCLEKYYATDARKNPVRKKEWYDRCLNYLNKSIEYDAMNPTRNANLGRFYRVQGRESADPAKRQEHFSLSLKYYEQACGLSPQHPALRNELGEVYHEMGWLDEAIRQYEKSLAIAPDFSETYSHLGDAYLEKKEMGNAVKNYYQAVKIQSRIMPDLRDPNQEEMFKRANATVIKHYPDDYRPHYNLGRYYAQKGRRAQAIEALEKALPLADKKTGAVIAESLERLKVGK